MRYLEQSFSVPPASLPNGKNTHGQTWEDIFKCSACGELPADCQCFNEPRQ